MSSDKVVLLGESGMLGGYLSLYFSERGIPFVAPARFDAAQIGEGELTGLLRSLRARVVINCIGIIRQRKTSETEMRAVNAEFPHRLSAVCEQLNVPLIHISTDCVFSGARPPRLARSSGEAGGAYLEHDTPDAPYAYGKSKAAGEPPNATVIRTSLIGSERRNKRSLLEWVKSNAGNEVDGYTNQQWNGVTCLQLAKFLEELTASDAYWQGVRHYFSPRAVSKYELVSLISAAYDLDVHVKKTDAKEARDMTLASEYDFVSPPDIEEQLREMYIFDKAHGLL